MFIKYIYSVTRMWLFTLQLYSTPPAQPILWTSPHLILCTIVTGPDEAFSASLSAFFAAGDKTVVISLLITVSAETGEQTVTP